MAATRTTTVTFAPTILDEGATVWPGGGITIEVRTFGSRVAVHFREWINDIALVEGESETLLQPGEGAAALFDRELRYGYTARYGRRDRALRALRPLLRAAADEAWVNGRNAA